MKFFSIIIILFSAFSIAFSDEVIDRKFELYVRKKANILISKYDEIIKSSKKSDSYKETFKKKKVHFVTTLNNQGAIKDSKASEKNKDAGDNNLKK